MVIVLTQQGWNIEIARRGDGVDGGGRAAPDAFDDFQLRAAHGDCLADPTEFSPGLGAVDDDVSAKARGCHWLASFAFKIAQRSEIDDGDVGRLHIRQPGCSRIDEPNRPTRIFEQRIEHALGTGLACRVENVANKKRVVRMGDF